LGITFFLRSILPCRENVDEVGDLGVNAM
jgi:hypothetical protein